MCKYAQWKKITFLCCIVHPGTNRRHFKALFLWQIRTSSRQDEHRVDKTYFSMIIFKHLALTRLDTDEHPLLFGLVFLHTRSNERTFLNFCLPLVKDSASHKNNSVISTDVEATLHSALLQGFPGAKHACSVPIMLTEI